MIPSRSDESETLAGAQGVALLARPVGQVRVVDPPMLEQPVLDVLVDRHHRLDVFQVVQPRAVADLVQGTHGDQVGGSALAVAVSVERGVGSGERGDRRDQIGRVGVHRRGAPSVW